MVRGFQCKKRLKRYQADMKRKITVILVGVILGLSVLSREENKSDIGLVSGINFQYYMYRQINRSCYAQWLLNPQNYQNTLTNKKLSSSKIP